MLLSKANDLRGQRVRSSSSSSPVVCRRRPPPPYKENSGRLFIVGHLTQLATMSPQARVVFVISCRRLCRLRYKRQNGFRPRRRQPLHTKLKSDFVEFPLCARQHGGLSQPVIVVVKIILVFTGARMFPEK